MSEPTIDIARLHSLASEAESAHGAFHAASKKASVAEKELMSTESLIRQQMLETPPDHRWWFEPDGERPQDVPKAFTRDRPERVVKELAKLKTIRDTAYRLRTEAEKLEAKLTTAISLRSRCARYARDLGKLPEQFQEYCR